jgi:dihydrofolate reductase
MSSGLCHRQRLMRTIISEFISMDGVVQAPGGPEEDTDGGFRHGGWSIPYFDPDVMGTAIGEMSSKTDALLYGTRTWRGMAGAWPDRAGDPFADWMNSVQKYLVSDSMNDADITWQPTTIIRRADMVKEVSRLRDQPGGYLNVWGSPTLVRALLEADLVDEFLLMIEPVILGGGKRIWADDGEARAFEPTSSKTATTGVQVCHYQRKR